MHVTLALAAVLLAVLLPWLPASLAPGAARAQQPPEPVWFDPAVAGSALGSFRLTRSDRVIVVQQYAPQAEGGQFRTNVPNCEPDLRMSTVYAPEPYAVVTQVAETSIVSQVVLARSPDGEDDDETLTMFGGSIGVDEVFCPEDPVKSGAEDVYILQGQTLVSGTELIYDNSTGLADLSGPVRLLRQAEDDGPEITAAAENLTFDVETELSTMRGDVVVRSAERISYADSLVLDEDAGLATLLGSPARSVQGEDEIRGNRLLYYLDTDDVVVEGAVSGTLELELD